jgi:DNA-binding transcriptional ArsR family regulator
MNGSDPHLTQTQPVLACLGVASRFRLVRALAVADRCVGELADAVGLSQSCTTRHLQALERVGLVRGRREGRRVRFRLRSEAPGLSELLGWALSGAGPEAATAGNDLPGDRSVPALAALQARPTPTIAALRARPTDTLPPRHEVAKTPNAEPGPDAPAGSCELEDSALPSVADQLPPRRRNDLEDYLL